jgi:hypothetical protein
MAQGRRKVYDPAELERRKVKLKRRRLRGGILLTEGVEVQAISSTS